MALMAVKKSPFPAVSAFVEIYVLCDEIFLELDEFIHKTYINVARKIYKNVYLFEINIQPLQVQKNF